MSYVNDAQEDDYLCCIWNENQIGPPYPVRVVRTARNARGGFKSFGRLYIVHYIIVQYIKLQNCTVHYITQLYSTLLYITVQYSTLHNCLGYGRCAVQECLDLRDKACQHREKPKACPSFGETFQLSLQVGWLHSYEQDRKHNRSAQREARSLPKLWGNLPIKPAGRLAS